MSGGRKYHNRTISPLHNELQILYMILNHHDSTFPHNELNDPLPGADPINYSPYLHLIVIATITPVPTNSTFSCSNNQFCSPFFFNR